MHEGTKRKMRARWIALAVVAAMLCLFFALRHHNKPNTPTDTTTVSLEEPIETKTPQQEAWFNNPSLSWRKITIQKGDTLYKVFKSQHIDYATLQKILSTDDAKKYLGRLRPGQTFYLYQNTDKQQLAIKYPADETQVFYIYSDQGAFKSELNKKPLKKHVIYKSAQITHNFSESARKAGLTHAQIHQLSQIFAGNINFSRDIRPGDNFAILYDEYYYHNKKQKPGNILAASFTSRGKTYKAIRYTYPYNHTSYYTPDGRGVEPLLNMHPVKYKRISSYFTLHRLDPVLHIIHPHLGVDFAAPRGTPIKSVGTGKVIFHGKKGGYGNAVVIRYSKKYKILYGHMSHFAHNLRNGKIVRQGEVIGYVGSTGWSTGPHLHFEVYVYGIPRNPLKMKFIGGKSVPKKYLPTFHEKADALLAELEMYKGQEFAMVEEENETNNE